MRPRSFIGPAFVVALALAFCGAGATFAGASPADDWAQLQYDAARTGYCSRSVGAPFRARWIWFGSEWVLRNRRSRPDDPRWKDDLTSRDGYDYRMPGKVPFCFASSMQPVVASERLFVADVQGKAYAIDAHDGSTLWTAENPGGSLWPAVATADIVVFTSLAGYVSAFDAATGRRLWRFDTGKSITSAPALVGRIVYVAGQSGHVYALDLAGGRLLWKSPYLGAGIQGGLCLQDGRLYTGTEALEAIALDAQSGKALARRRLMGQSFRFLWPVAVADRVIFTTVPIICVGSEYVNDAVLAGKPGQTVGWDPKLRPGHDSIFAEQQALRRWLAGPGKQWETCFALRSDGLEKDYVVATGATEGCGTPPEPPTIDGRGRPLVWWATGHPKLTNHDAFGTNFAVDVSALDLATGLRIPIDNGRLAGQPAETDNLYGMTVAGDMLYLRQNFRGTYAIDLKTSQGHRISAVYRYRDQGGWPAAVNYANGQISGVWGPEVVRVPTTPPAPGGGRVGPSIACGRLYFTESFCVTCVETGE